MTQGLAVSHCLIPQIIHVSSPSEKYWSHVLAIHLSSIQLMYFLRAVWGEAGCFCPIFSQQFSVESQELGGDSSRKKPDILDRRSSLGLIDSSVK